jgi:hypothetical protein
MTAACEHDEAEHLATRRLTFATWALVIVTALLCVVTVLLAEATWMEKTRPAAAVTTQQEPQP